MTLADDAKVTLILADYIDSSSGKLHLLGGAFTIAQLQPNGLSGPHFVQVIIDVPATYRGQDFVLGLELRDDESGTAVSVPSAGGPQAMRIQQVQRVEPPATPPGGAPLPPDFPTRIQVGIGLMDGLPLGAGRYYSWVVSIDGHTRPWWSTTFWVAGQVRPPVFGGPASPSSIPGISPPH